VSTRRLLRTLARAGLAATFVSGGWHAAQDPGDRPAKAASLGLPEDPRLVRANGVAMVVGGVALTLGVLPRLAAAGLIASLVPTSAAGHPFWRDADPAVRAQHLNQTLKHLGLVGGLLLVATER